MLKKLIISWLLIILLIITGAEISCRFLDRIDSWKKHGDWNQKRVFWREQSYTIKKPAGVKRIILLGGSAAYDTVDHYKNTWPHRLEQILNQKLKSKVEVINMGFYTETSADELYKLNAFAKSLSPDLVIVFDGFNDVYNLWHDFDYWRNIHEMRLRSLQPRTNPLSRKELGRWITKNSSFLQRFYRARTWFKKKLSLLIFNLKKMKNEKESKIFSGANTLTLATDSFFAEKSKWPEIFRSYSEFFGGNQMRMAALIKQMNAKGLFIFQPDLSYKPLLTFQATDAEKQEYLRVLGKHEETWHTIIAQAYPEGLKLKLAAAKSQGFSFHDFNTRLFMEPETASWFDGNVHFRDPGRKIISEEVATIILQEKLLE